MNKRQPKRPDELGSRPPAGLVAWARLFGGRCSSWRVGRVGAPLVLGTLVLAAIAAALMAGPSITTPTHRSPPVLRPEGASGAVIVPDRFLRRWDPVTVFFTGDTGPGAGTPEDHSERYVTLNPSHPGAWTWLNRRTLQFKPADPWPPLSRYTWTIGRTRRLVSTLMAPPQSTQPWDGAEGLTAVDTLELVFTDPIPVDALAQMIRLELRPLPGLGGGGSRWRTAEDFRIKTQERANPSAVARYVLTLNNPIPLGTRAILHFRLSLDDGTEQSFAQVAFSTAEPFRASSLGCQSNRVPIAPNGSRYAPDQALRCEEGEPSIVVALTSEPTAFTPVLGRNLVRFEPSVANLVFEVQGRQLQVTGDFQKERLYKVSLHPTALEDVNGRPLDLSGPSQVYVYFPPQAPFLTWGASQGIIERLGPQQVPIEARGQDRVDLRIQAIDPLDRSFWPFPETAVGVDESIRPPGPGEVPAPWQDTRANFGQDIGWSGIRQQLQALTTPAFSRLVDVPSTRARGAASLGLDLAGPLTYIRGKNAPGTYLVGIRPLDGTTHRSWIRVQVTDLSLSVVEGLDDVVFVVTSLASGRPVAGATIRLEGSWKARNKKIPWGVHWQGTTDGEGRVRWTTPGRGEQRRLRRIVVQKDRDTLVLDPKRPPERYADNHWRGHRGTWLQWAFEHEGSRKPPPETLCHIFTERPVYRPEEGVHIKGYVRKHHEGKLLKFGAKKRTLVVDGPGNLIWRYPIQLTGQGDFYLKWLEEKLPGGVYRAWLDEAGCQDHPVSFRKEAYRIPKFEVKIHAPDITPLDGTFEASLTARYYAGGRVAKAPIRWRVTQFPYTWSPKKLEGFLYASDGRFSRTRRFESTGALEQDGETDADGEVRITVKPALEPTAQPRTYVIEATVTGMDDQTVTATRKVNAVPASVVGLKVPRYLPLATQISPEVIVVGPDGALKPGQEITVRLFQRQWHSYLRASDFTDGVARYVTDVVDEKLQETKIISQAQVVPVPFDLPKAGVYIVEVEARDRLGRAQVVRIDLYAGGGEAVSWAKPEANVFTITPDKSRYDPGETAHLILQSPFQEGRALVIVEGPAGNDYRWTQVRGGSATIPIPITQRYVPRLPVHVILMRGRLEGSLPRPGDTVDPGKPTTMAATAWIAVNPVENRIEITLAHAATKQPGEQLEMAVKLRTPAGRPLAGEVTLWLVDRAVRVLGKEQALDPLPDFMARIRSKLKIRDTRNLVFGRLPFVPRPGGDGDEGEDEAADLLERTTVRKNFKTVPYFEPRLKVGVSGVARVTIELPDNLTVFDVRAKAVSGPDRFGFAKSEVAVRLPVIVQPNLPRFVRAGDQFVATAIGRVVEGVGGAGACQIKVDGVDLEGPSRQKVTWVPNTPVRFEFPVTVPTPRYTAEGKLERTQVQFTVGVERQVDRASDAFQVSLPLLEDRPPQVERSIAVLEPGESLTLEGLPEPARVGTIRRTLTLSDQPRLVQMTAGLQFLREYPYGCTEQRISRARAYVALKRFRDALKLEVDDAEMDRAVRETLEYLPEAFDDHRLVAYWPGSQGFVILSAWALEFLVEARDAGYSVDDGLVASLTRSLSQALRSDYRGFVEGAAYIERAWALSALARAGQFEEAYASELARRAQNLNQEARARVVTAFAFAGRGKSSAVASLAEGLWHGVVFRLQQGREIYGGLQDDPSRDAGAILPTEARTLAETLRALTLVGGDGGRMVPLVDALVSLGTGDGWGTTNANAAALLALAEGLTPPILGAGPATARVDWGGSVATLTLGPDEAVAQAVDTTGGEGQLTVVRGAKPIVARLDRRFIPTADGSQMVALSKGFVVARTLLKIQEGGAPPVKIPLETPGKEVVLAVGDVVEEHLQVVNPEARFYVAIQVPLAAGLEPLNPALATAPPEATPSGQLTLRPTHASYMDDHVAFFYNQLPRGTYDFYFRTRATVEGRFVQPGASAALMYDGAVRGGSAGARIVVRREGRE